jgi:hypothetical protein
VLCFVVLLLAIIMAAWGATGLLLQPISTPDRYAHTCCTKHLSLLLFLPPPVLPWPLPELCKCPGDLHGHPPTTGSWACHCCFPCSLICR